MIDPAHGLSLTRQAAALGISRGSIYYLPKPPSQRDLDLMNRIDRLHLELPFAGTRMLRDLLNDEGFKVGRKHVATLMRKMGIEALYRRPKTTKRHPQHRVYPYLIRNLPITRANQVWAMDIVRHEAPCKRVEVIGLYPLAVAAAGEKLRAARPRRCGERVDSSPDNAVTGWHC